ncbi:MAG: cysteine-rich small domain-containing protein [Lachnospiraceae bacterium]|nr:cysteine-rich small domain-containing protein [Lachnospiraceae bacterium]
MDNSYRFFANRDCKYYPCHEGIEELNCLFCYCPFYLRTQCPGKPTFVETEKGIVKDCTGCCFPHRPENYEVILEWLRRQVYRSPEEVGGKDRVLSE